MTASAIGPRFGKICFSSLLIAIFTMLSYSQHEDVWSLPPKLLAGAVGYFLLSTLIQRLIPNFNLESDTQQLFSTLARYQLLKARLFDAEADLNDVRLQLARQSAQSAKSACRCQAAAYREAAAIEKGESPVWLPGAFF